jgi:hypothetical protein
MITPRQKIHLISYVNNEGCSDDAENIARHHMKLGRRVGQVFLYAPHLL